MIKNVHVYIALTEKSHFVSITLHVTLFTEVLVVPLQSFRLNKSRQGFLLHAKQFTSAESNPQSTYYTAVSCVGSKWLYDKRNIKEGVFTSTLISTLQNNIA